MSRTNKITAMFHYDKIREDFLIFQLKRDSGKISSTTIDALSLNAIVAIQYTIGSYRALLLLRKGMEKELLEKFESDHKYDDFTLRQIDPEFVDDRESVFGTNDRFLIQLLFNSLASYESETYRKNNITGKLLYHIASKNANSRQIFLNVILDETNHLQLNVETYTKYVPAKENKKIPERTKYLYDKKTGDFRKATEAEIKKRIVYEKRNPFERSTVDYININHLQSFTKSKLGILEQFLFEVEDRLSPYMEVTFEKKEAIQKYDVLENNLSLLDDEDDKDNKMNQIKPIRIIDIVCNEESEKITAYIKKILEQGYGLSVSSGPIDPDFYNIRVIHNKDYYEKRKEKDLHNNILENSVVQHVTVENFEIDKKMDKEEHAKKLRKEPQVKNILHEMLIKEDIMRKKITTFKWTIFAKGKEWTFISWSKNKTKDAKQPTIFYMIKILPDGTFTYSFCSNANMVAPTEEWERVRDKYYELAYEKEKSKKAFLQKYGVTVEGFFYTDINNICILSKTSEYIIPNINNIKEELVRTNPHTEIAKEDLLKAIHNFIEVLEKHPKKDTYIELAKALLLSITMEKKEFLKKRDIKNIISKITNSRGFISELNRFLDIRYDMKITYDLRYKTKEYTYRYGELYDLCYHCFVDDSGNNVIEYAIGSKSPLDLKVTRANPIRKILSKESIPQNILSLMTVEFVRNGQYTVHPFPFKYIREFFAWMENYDEPESDSAE